MNDYNLLDAITTTTATAASGSRPNPSCNTHADPHFADRLRPDLSAVPCPCSSMSHATDMGGMTMRPSPSSSSSASSSPQSRSHEAEEDGDGTGRRPADSSAARDSKLLLLHHHNHQHDAAATSSASSGSCCTSSTSTTTITPSAGTKAKTSSGTMTTTTDMTKERDKVHCCVPPQGAAFSPSPEILFLVQQQAKTLSCLSAISKRLEELEVKVCDIQRTVFANSKISSKTKTTMDHLIPSSSKCSASGSQQLNVLSDDSGGEYSRTTSGTNVDEDELISLLDQIAKYSQTIRDTQQNQAQQQLASLAMSSPQHQHHRQPHHQPAVHSQHQNQQSHAVPRGLHPDTRRDPQQHHHHNHDHGAAVDHPSSSPAVLMSDHPAVASSHSSAARLHHHHNHAHHQNQAMLQQQQQPQLHRNPSLTHASSHPTRSSMSAFPALRTTADRTEFRSSGHVATAAPPAESTVSSLGALLFDPNLSSVLTNLLTPPRSRNRDPF